MIERNTGRIAISFKKMSEVVVTFLQELQLLPLELKNS